MGVSTWVRAFEEARRGCWVFWSWSQWGCEPPSVGAGKPKGGPRQGQSRCSEVLRLLSSSSCVVSRRIWWQHFYLPTLK